MNPGTRRTAQDVTENGEVAKLGKPANGKIVVDPNDNGPHLGQKEGAE